MRIPRPRRKASLIGAGALALLLVAAGVLGAGRSSAGWFDSGSVEGTTVGLRAAEAPRGQRDRRLVARVRLRRRRTRANPALDLAPPFRRRWSRDAGSLLEFPPVLADGRAIVGTNAGLALAIDLDTGRELWQRRPARPGGVLPRDRRRRWPCSPPSAAACWPSRRPPAARVWRRAAGLRLRVVARSWWAARPTWDAVSGRVVRLDVRTGGVRGRRGPRATSRRASRCRGRTSWWATTPAG